MKVNIQLSFSSDIEERYCQILQQKQHISYGLTKPKNISKDK